MGENSVNFSFNKGQNVNLSKFDGVSKEELLKRQGISDKQKALLESIFRKYDNGDGILTKEEFQQMQADLVRIAGDNNLGKRELKKFNTNLGVDKKAYSMEDLQSLVGVMVDGTDSITGVKTEGTKLTITYNPEMTRGVTEQVFENEVLFSKTRNYSDAIEIGDVKLENPTEILTYGDDGKTVIKSVRKGSGPNAPILVTYYDYDNEGAVLNRQLDYTTQEGHVTVLYGNDINKPTQKTITKPNGEQVVEDYTKADVIENSGDAEGDVVQEKPAITEYQVQKGEVWYNLVAAKYGVSDPKIIMEIVHQLKDANGINKNQKTMPSAVNLPNEITVGDETFPLDTTKAADASLLRKETPVRKKEQTQSGGVVAKDPNPPVAKTTPPRQYSIPPIATKAVPLRALPSVGKSLQKVDMSLAGKTVTNPDGTKTEYNDDGRVSRVLDAQGRTKYARLSDRLYQEFEYNGSEKYCARCTYRNYDGSVDSYKDYEYDSKGNESRFVLRDASGKIEKIYEHSYDTSGNLIRNAERDAQGHLSDYYDIERNSEGVSTRYVFRNPDGTIRSYCNTDDNKYRNPDGTLNKSN